MTVELVTRWELAVPESPSDTKPLVAYDDMSAAHSREIIKITVIVR